jgi:hypothetical protein
VFLLKTGHLASGSSRQFSHDKLHKLPIRYFLYLLGEVQGKNSGLSRQARILTGF